MRAARGKRERERHRERETERERETQRERDTERERTERSGVDRLVSPFP